jgi:polyhydroxyalkanoate synthase
MWQQGYLDTRQMAGAFQLLRSNDLIWSRRLRHYLLDIPDKQRPDGLECRRHPHALPHAFGVPAPPVPEKRPGQRPLPVDGRPVALTDIHIRRSSRSAP